MTTQEQNQLASKIVAAITPVIKASQARQSAIKPAAGAGKPTVKATAKPAAKVVNGSLQVTAVSFTPAPKSAQATALEKAAANVRRMYKYR